MTRVDFDLGTALETPPCRAFRTGESLRNDLFNVCYRLAVTMTPKPSKDPKLADSNVERLVQRRVLDRSKRLDVLGKLLGE